MKTREIFRRGFLALVLVVLLGGILGCSGPLAVFHPTPAPTPTPTPTPTPLPFPEAYVDLSVPPSEYIQAERFLKTEIGWALQELGFEPRGPCLSIVSHSYILTLSPRDEIRTVGSKVFSGELSPEEIASSESDAASAGNHVAFVRERLGTFSIAGGYPHISVRANNIRMMVLVAVHEWIHSYLWLTPLSVHDSTPEMKMLNEVTTRAGEEEISKLIFTKYGWKMQQHTSVCRNGKLHPVRTEVDRLLIEGKIEEAEVYMEEMRLELCSGDWCPHKLNQAFFAACEPYGGGAEGDNPIPKMVRELRAQYPTLKGFLEAMREVSSYEDFLVLCESKGIDLP